MADLLDMLDVIFSTTDAKLASAEALLMQNCSHNESKVAEFNDDVDKRLDSLSDDINNLAKKCEVIQGQFGRKKELVALHEELLKRHDVQLCDLEATRDAIAKETAKLKEENEELEASKKKVHDKLETTKSFLDRCKLFLGLQVKKTKDGNLLIAFVNVNRDDPTEQFFFQINLDGETYVVSDCCPRLKDLDAIVERLNRENDLRQFVCKVRKRFCAISRKQESVAASSST